MTADLQDDHSLPRSEPGPDTLRTTSTIWQDRSGTTEFLLSIVMPAYNEEETVLSVISTLLTVPMPAPIELIVVDDGSKDRTGALLATVTDPRVRVVSHQVNQGKGAAVRTGVAAAIGSHVLVFDADLEYDPNDIAGLIAPLLTNRAELVYGVRLRGINTIHPTAMHAFGNWLMTQTTNVLYGSAISDLHTCLKLLPLPLMRSLTLSETGFGRDTEITAEVLRRGFRPYELPVSYVGRSKEEGKKIGGSDAVRCFYVLAKVRLRGVTRPGLRDRRLVPAVVPPTCAPAETATEATAAAATVRRNTRAKTPARRSTKGPARETHSEGEQS